MSRPSDEVVSSEEGRRRFVVLLALTLFGFGLVMVASAASGTSLLDDGDPWNYLKRQILWGSLGIVAMGVAMHLPLGLLRRLAPALLLASAILMLAVFLPGLGITVNGARRWLALGPISIQPSELAKLGLVLYLADHLARSAIPRTVAELLKPAGAVAAGVCLIIFLQRDLGTALVAGFVVVWMYTLRGTAWRLLAKTISPALLGVVLGIVTEPYRRERFMAFIDPWDDAQGSGFQLVQGLIAIGSGGILGTGLGHSVQKIHYVPEAHTDMIYTIVSEELGLLGSLFVLVAFAGLAIVGTRIALKAKTRYQALLAAGITAMLCGQAVLNLGGVVGVLPLTGVPLPLVSYGGSSLIVVFIALGLLANIATAGRTSRN